MIHGVMVVVVHESTEVTAECRSVYESSVISSM